MRNYFITILLLISISGCNRDEIDLGQIQNLNGNKITPLGHAGMGIASLFPINSFESVSNAIHLGAEGVEIDVQMTSDSVLILYHDRTLEEMTNLQGMIYENDWADVQDAIYQDPIFTSYHIASLDDLLGNLENAKDYYFSLDLKLFEPNHPDSYISTYLNALTEIIDRYDMVDNIFIEFKRREYLEKFKTQRPDLQLLAFSNFEDGLSLANEFDLFGLVVKNDQVTKSQVQQAHDEGFRVNIFGLLSKDDNLDAIEKNPDFLQTDKVKHLVKVLK